MTQFMPRRFPALALAAAVVIALVVGGGVAFWVGRDRGPTIGGPFSLTDANGRTVTEADFRGRYMLVYFGYTYCPDVCPTTLNQVAEAMDKLGEEANRITPVFITVDPARDTPAVIKQYLAAFSPKLVGLTGSPEAIAKVAKEYRVYYAVHQIGGGAADYTVDHSSILYLMGPDGRFIAPIPADDSGADMAAAVSRYIAS